MNSATDKDLINSLNGSRDLNPEQLEEFYVAFRTNETLFKNHLNKQSGLLRRLESKYQLSKIDNSQFASLIEPLIISIVEMPITTTEKSCKARYAAALTIIGVAAYNAHVACLPADLTGFGGLACHGAVALVQVAASYLAFGEYEDCLAGK